MLIAAFAVYAIVGTLVPQGETSELLVQDWAESHPAAEAVVGPLGLHHAHSAPVFLALAALLAAATGVCAWERSRRALRAIRSMRSLSQPLLERLRRRPEGSVLIAADADPLAVLSGTAMGLEKSGLRVNQRSDSVDGITGIVGVWGSPILHWSLLALMLVVGVGWATRSEGLMALPLQERVADEHSNYIQVVDGALFGEHHSGIEFVASEIDRHYISGGVDFGPTPLVVAYADGIEVAKDWVRPNNPLRVGSMMVHMVEFGPAVTLALESSDGAEVGRKTLTLDRSDETSTGTQPQELVLSPGTGTEAVRVRVQVLVYNAASQASSDQVSRAIVETATVDSEVFGPPVMLAVSDALDLPGGHRLRVARVKDWVRVSVVNDWSVPFIYGLLLLAITGLGAAVLVPTRRASVLLVEQDGLWSLHVATWHSRRDPLFRTRIMDIVREAACAEEGL